MNYKKYKVIIFGANSYLGRNLIYKIIHEYSGSFELMLFDRQSNQEEGIGDYHQVNVLDRKALNSIDFECDLIYIFVGKTGTVGGFDDYESYIDVNEKTLLNIVAAYRHHNSQARLIFPSTRLVYRGEKERPLPEDAALEFKTIYAINKFSCEQYLKMYRNAFNLQYSVFRICVPYGTLVPGATSYGTIDFFLSKAKKGENILLYGDGSQKRTLIYIDDLCEALIRGATNRNCKNDIFNIGGADHMSLYQMAQEIAAAYRVHVEFAEWPETVKKIESGDTIFDSTKFDQATGFRYTRHFTEWVRGKASGQQ